LPALEHHVYSEDDVGEGGIKIKKIIFFHENGNFFGRRSGEKKVKNNKNKILFLFKITTFGCRRVR
jgi:hypothetical protein